MAVRTIPNHGWGATPIAPTAITHAIMALTPNTETLTNLFVDLDGTDRIDTWTDLRVWLRRFVQSSDISALDAAAAINYQDTQLTSAQVKALAATNITVVSAPGAGLAVVPIAVHLFLDHAGTNDFVQTVGGDHLALRYSATTEIAEIGTEAQFTTFIEASADAALYDTIEGASAAGTVPIANKAIDLDNNGANEFTGNAGADNTISIRVFYRTVPMAAFS